MSSSPAQMLADYVLAFESQRAEAVVPFYALPCTFLRPDGVWVVQDEATALVLVRHLLDHARSQGYHRTETLDLAVRELASSLAELSGVFVRRDSGGSEVGRFGFTYLLRAESGAWRIVVAVAHDAPPEPGEERA